MRKPIIERFNEKWKEEKATSCWLWQGSLNKSGYGFFRDGKMVYAHRWIYEHAYKKKLKDNILVCHKCDEPRCVRPSHLFEGTHQDNADDREFKGRGNQAQGSVHSQAKLTDEQVLEIRTLRNYGMKLWEIGELYGIVN